jgi:TolB-like protein/DNA-binding winged helix-turn-helix (wHTH) protein/Flp pilus assembly protein TadD
MSRAIGQFYHFGDFKVDRDQKILLRQGKPLPLTPKVFDTLLVLIENSGRIVEKEKLMSRLWPDTFVEEANLTFNIQQLRKALGDDARHPQFIETVARRGYRFIAHVEEALDSGVASSQIASTRIEAADSELVIGGDEFKSDLGLVKPPEIELPGAGRSDKALKAKTAGEMSRTSRGKTRLAAAAVAVVLIATGLLLLLRHRSSARSQQDSGRLMLAVLPFQNLTGNTAQDYFSDGLTEEMITQLGNLDPDHLGVIARTSVMHYKNNQEPLDQIGRELQVQYVLEGSVRRESDRVRITTQLIQIKDQTHVWSREYDRELIHLLSLQGEIAKEVADDIHLTLGDHTRTEPVSQSLSTKSPDAYDLYLRGQYCWNKRWLKQAIEYFQRATAEDPNYARAYAGLADCYALMGGYSGRPQNEFMPQARTAALRALELDGNLAEAHTALALIVQNYDYDWQTAEKEYRRAIELNPNYATAHHWYAEHLAWMGRFDEALRESERARQLDPLSLIIAVDNGAILYFSRQYDQAIQEFRAVQEMEPNFPRVHIVVFAYVEKGMYAEALADTKNWREAGSSPWFWSVLAYTYGRAGQQPEAQRALDKLLELNRRQQIDPSALIQVYIGMGNKDQAFVWLENAYSQHSSLTTLKVDPIYDSLRSDPRFQDLLRRVGLAQ